MHDMVRVTWDDLRFGEKLPWNIYDEHGKLLLRSGHVISKDGTMEHLRRYVMYRNVVDAEHQRRNKRKKINAFNEAEKLVQRLELMFIDIEAAQPESKEKIERLANDVIELCRLEADGALAILRLPHNYSYAAYYTLQCAILSALLVIHEDLLPTEQEAIVAAALTANVGMLEVLNRLNQENHFITDDELDIIDMHVDESVTLLKAAGIDNKMWLAIVLAHHEQLDGSGYPNAMYAKDIPRGAMMLAVAGHYCESLLHHNNRQAGSVDEAMKLFFGDNGEKFDRDYARLLLELFTIYPPGCFVKLSNGETAIVIRRGKQDSTLPILKSITGPNGQRYANPLLRDCSINDYVIDGFCEYAQKDILNYENLWGYVK